MNKETSEETICINGHSYEPRYDEFDGIPEKAIEEAGKWRGSKHAREFLEGVPKTKSKTYICDICPRCGDVITRP